MPAPRRPLLALVIAGAACATVARLAPGPEPKLDRRFHQGEPERSQTLVLDVLALADPDLDGHDDLTLWGIFGDRLYAGPASRWHVYGIPLTSERRIAELVEPDGQLRPEAHGSHVSAADIGSPRELAVDAGGAIYTVDTQCRIEGAAGAKRDLGHCQGTPHALFVDATHVYVFTERPSKPGDLGSRATLWSVPKTAAAPPALIADLGLALWGLFPSDRPLQDDGAFYFVQPEELLRIAKPRGPVVRLARAPSERIFHGPRLVDAGQVYWNMEVFGGDTPAKESYLVRAPTAGGPPVAVDTPAGALAIVGDRLYEATGRALYAAPRAGGDWERVAVLPEGQWSLRAVAGKLYAVDRAAVIAIDPAGPHARRLVDEDHGQRWIGSLALRGARLFYTAGVGDDPGQALWSMPKTGGAPTRLVAVEAFGSAPAIDDRRAYFLAPDGALRAAPLDGGPIATLVAAKQPDAHLPRDDLDLNDGNEAGYLLPETVAGDDDSVYWIDHPDTALRRVSKRGGPAQVLAQVPGASNKIEIDGDFVYVGGLDRLLRVRKTGGPIERLATADDASLVFAATAGGAIWAASERLYGLSPDTGFAVLGHAGTLNHGDGTDRQRVPAVAARGDTLFYTRSTRSQEDGLVIARSRSRGALRVLGAGHRTPTRLRVDEGAVYFIDAGEPFSYRGGVVDTVGCCSIWTAPAG